MKTLIELYDERPVENILATEMFCSERTVFLCPPEIAGEKEAERRIRAYAAYRGLKTKMVFVSTSRYSASAIKATLKKVASRYPDCVMDITGGSDAALFACGMLCEELGLPAFTFSRKTKCFYNIHNAPFANEMPCRITYFVEDYFLMAGGVMRQGRVDNQILRQYASFYTPFFMLYLSHKREWHQLISYMQRVSYKDKNGVVSLQVNAPLAVKAEKGTVSAPVEMLSALTEMGFLHDLAIKGNETLSFAFHDEQIRTWLRDVGSVLELYVYEACFGTGIFDDVRASVVVDWEASQGRDIVTNEIDVMATRGIVPLFISCKTCPVTTDALNELAILRGRFGGKLAKAAIVTTSQCRAVTRHRADELDIRVIDLDDLREGRLSALLTQLMLSD